MATLPAAAASVAALSRQWHAPKADNLQKKKQRAGWIVLREEVPGQLRHSWLVEGHVSRKKGREPQCELISFCEAKLSDATGSVICLRWDPVKPLRSMDRFGQIDVTNVTRPVMPEQMLRIFWRGSAAVLMALGMAVALAGERQAKHERQAISVVSEVSVPKLVRSAFSHWQVAIGRRCGLILHVVIARTGSLLLLLTCQDFFLGSFQLWLLLWAWAAWLHHYLLRALGEVQTMPKEVQGRKVSNWLEIARPPWCSATSFDRNSRPSVCSVQVWRVWWVSQVGWTTLTVALMCTGLAVDWAPSEFRGFLLGAASAAGLGLGKYTCILSQQISIMMKIRHGNTLIMTLIVVQY